MCNIYIQYTISNDMYNHYDYDDDSISFTINGTLGYTHIRDKKKGLEFDELRD